MDTGIRRRLVVYGHGRFGARRLRSPAVIARAALQITTNPNPRLFTVNSRNITADDIVSLVRDLVDDQEQATIVLGAVLKDYTAAPTASRNGEPPPHTHARTLICVRRWFASLATARAPHVASAAKAAIRLKRALIERQTPNTNRHMSGCPACVELCHTPARCCKCVLPMPRHPDDHVALLTLPCARLPCARLLCRVPRCPGYRCGGRVERGRHAARRGGDDAARP